jgi:K+-sensing histidine kinase KdpD
VTLREASQAPSAGSWPELRTPVTALRTNMEVLAARGELEHDARRASVRPMVGRWAELAAVVGVLIHLARDDAVNPLVEEVAFERMVAEAVERVGRHAQGCGSDRSEALRGRRRAQAAGACDRRHPR